MTTVVVGAHPDDEVLGAGGTLAAWCAEGEDVHAIVCSEGATSRYSEEQQEELAKACQRAAEAIGFRSLRLEHFPDQRLDAVPLVEVTQRLEALLLPLRPRTVLMHFPGDVNRDHGVVAHATWTACRPYAMPSVRTVLAFETPSSTEWAWPLPESAFRPNLFVDVAAVMDRKIAAMECYGSELRDHPHPRSVRALQARAAHWGSVVGLTAAESFMILRQVLP